MNPSSPGNHRLAAGEIARLLASHHVPPAIPPENLRWRRASVLVPLLEEGGEWHLFFIRRTESVAEHKGQVAFPGGGMEPQDRTVIDTALREAQEEVGLAPSAVHILGHLPEFFTITNYLITPVVGVVSWPFQALLSPEEVSRAFTIPLNWLADPRHYEERPFVRPNGRDDKVIYYQPYDGETLWGATARITVIFLQILGLL